MPVRDALRTPGVDAEETLHAELVEEIMNPRPSGEPDIVIERPNPSTSHLFVIWSKWAGLEQMVRSRIILDAYKEAAGDQEAVKVTVAMGLTPSEAKSLGVE